MAVTDADILGWLNANPGADDTLIANTMRDAGVDPARMAQVTGLDYGNVAQRYETALAPLSAVTSGQNAVLENTSNNYYGDYDSNTNTGANTGALAQASTVTAPNYDQIIQNAYGTIGRTGVGEGTNQIDQGGYNHFLNMLQTGVVKPEEFSNVFSGAVDRYIADNPDDAYTKYVQGYLADKSGTTATGALSNVVDTAASKADTAGALTQADTGSTTDNATSVATGATTDTTNPTVKLYQDTLGRTPSQEEIDSWNFGSTIDAQELDRFLGAARNEAVTTMPTTGVVNKLANQILAQGKTQYWGGEGYGSAEKNAYDMAVLLAGQGFTDINDLGKVTKTVDVAVTPIFESVDTGGYDENGPIITQKIVGYQDAQGNTVDPNLVKTDYVYEGEGGGQTVYVAPVGKQEVFGNVKTGEAINSYYDKASQNGPDIWGGTFAGEGSTAYGVKFDVSGKPVFYSKYGGSSNDLVNLVADNPILGAVANYAAFQFGGPAGVAALQAAMGKSIEDIAKSTLLAYVGGEIAGNVSGSTELVNSVGADAANVIGRSVGKYVSSEGKADIVQSLAGGAVDYGVNQITNLIPDFGTLSQGAQDFTKTVVATTIKNGGDLSINELVDAAFTAGTAATKAATTGTIAKAIEADKTINDAVTAEIDNQMTVDASGAMDINAAAKFAEDSGYNKFTFDGKTYTLDNNNAANTIAQLESDALATNTAANLKGGEFEGVDAAVAANAKANNTVIGNAEADNLEEAAYLAKQRNPTGTTFTFDGKTYTLGASSTAVTQALNETQKNAVLDDIKNAKTFNEAFATARAGLGAGQTFTWQGKEYSTATAAERPDLSGPTIDQLNKANLATVTDASKTVGAQSDTAARNAGLEATAAQQAAQKTAIASMEKTGFWSDLGSKIQGQMKLSSEAANDFLKNNPDSPITNSVSTAYEAAGNLEKNVAGGLALLTNNKPLADAFVKSGNDLTKLGQSIGNGVVDTKNWNDTTSLIQNAKGWEKVGILAGRIMDGTSGLGRQVEVELRQELPGLFLGGGTVKGILIATGTMDTAETAGNAALDTYDESIKKGKTHADALTDARKAGAAAGMAEAAVQLTLGKVADVVVGKIGNIGAKAGTKIVGEGVVEGGQEGGSSLAVNAILGQELDANKALTQTVLGTAVGKGTAVATSPTDIATTQTINNNISTAITAGDKAGVNTAITNSVQTSLSSGSSVELAVGTSVNSAITNGADAGTSITAAVSSAFESGADVNQTVTASIDSSITAGANTSVAINSTVTSAITSGANVSQTVSSSITASTKAGVGAETAINNTVSSSIAASINSGADASTSINSTVTSAITTAVNNNVNASTAITTSVDSAVTTALNSNVNATTAIETSVTAAINASVNANANTNTNANVNANVTVAVNAAVAAAVNAGVDTNTAVNAAVNAANNANINANININIDEIKNTANETATTTLDKIDLVKSVNDLISGSLTATPTTTPKTPTKTTAKKAAGLTSGLIAGAAMAGDLDRLPPQMLKAYMTQDKFVDPLAKLQALQEDMNTEKMPALPQVNTQEPDMPDQGTWKYGTAPDDLDSLFGKNEEEEEGSLGFKAGGYVAPLQMASGGAMPLPLLVKSGGALGALPRGDGRLDFRHGAHVAGEGDGQSDDIKAMLADGEFVFPADVVSALGNGSTKAGSDKLYEMMHSIRARARSKKPKDLPPPALKSPLDYLKKVRSK